VPRRLVVIALTGCLALTQAACAAKPRPAAAPPAISLGLNLELSGPGAVLGKAEKQGLDIAVNDINQNGGVDGAKLRIVVRDNRTDPKLAIQNTKDLAARHVSAMIGTALSQLAVPVAATAEQLKLPDISIATSQAVVNPVAQHRYTFKLAPNNADMAVVQAQELANRGVHRVAYFAPSDAYGDSSAAAFVPAARRAGLDVVAVERFADTQQSLAPQVADALGHQPDGIAAAVIPPQSVILAATVRAVHFAGPVIFDAGAGAELFVAAAGRASEGMFMVYDQIMASDHELATTPTALRQREFFEEYTRTYGQFSGFAALGADAVYVLTLAIARARNTTPARIQSALERTNYDGLGGRYAFSPQYHGGMAADSLTTLTVRDGGWIPAS
jgi:branched-chain amino acid transport system substrate-binding protein